MTSGNAGPYLKELASAACKCQIRYVGVLWLGEVTNVFLRTRVPNLCLGISSNPNSNWVVPPSITHHKGGPPWQTTQV